jgi:dethiobiotin synthetase
MQAHLICPFAISTCPYKTITFARSMNNQNIIFISGIGTDVGKTVVSAIVAQSLKANYWKPVQAGDLENTDSHKVRTLCDENVTILDEKHRFKTPMSPHGAAEIDGKEIILTDFDVPQFEGNLVIEGAGGLMVPLNSNGLSLVDVLQIKRWPVLLVSRHYLGSINHTLLSIEVLKKRDITIAGIVFVGDENPSTESIVAKIAGVKILGRIPIVEEVNKTFIQEQAAQFQF